MSRRSLHVEQLEDRRMLSVVLGPIAPPIGSALSAASVAHPAALVASADAGPTISKVAVSPAQGLLTWNAIGSRGVESSGLTVDGSPVTNIQGPWTTSSGVNYAWTYTALSSGSHTYTITATDDAGNASQYSGRFVVGTDTGPTISKVAVSTAQQVITWNAAASAGVESSSLTIDGAAVTKISGPYTAPPGVNYSGAFGTLSAGTHTYVITAIDGNSQSWQYTGTFVVGVASPTIGEVLVSANQGEITWNAAAATGVASSSLAIDGTAVTGLFGPYQAPPGVNYGGVYGPLASGNHTYVITAIDGAGQTTQSVGVFHITGPTISKVAVSASQQVITWNAAAATGVESTSLTVDGVAVTNLCGPYLRPPA